MTDQKQTEANASTATNSTAADGVAAMSLSGSGKITLAGKEYKVLGSSEGTKSGAYDVIVLGTGIQCSLINLLMAQAGKRVLQLDRECVVGGEGASLSLKDAFIRFEGANAWNPQWVSGKWKSPTHPALGESRNWSIDLCPKFIMAQGDMVKLLVHALGAERVSMYASYGSIGCSFVYKGAGVSSGFFGGGEKKYLFKVPSTAAEALSTPLMGMFQKRKLRNFLNQCRNTNLAAAAAGQDRNLPPNMTAAQLYEKHGLDENTQSFIGHAMALFDNDAYLNRPAIELVKACTLYAQSALTHEGTGSPYLYPAAGIGEISGGFSRYSAVMGERLGGQCMLGNFLKTKANVDPETKQCGTNKIELVFNKKGVCEGVNCGTEGAASAPVIIGDPSYFPATMLKKTGRVIRSICLLKGPVNGTDNVHSCQIVIPYDQVAKGGYPARRNDVYITVVGNVQETAPEGHYVAICSTKVETNNPANELGVAINLLNQPRGNIVARWDTVCDTFAPKDATGKVDHCFIVDSYSPEAHFGDVSANVKQIYTRVMGKPLDMSLQVAGALEGK